MKITEDLTKRLLANADLQMAWDKFELGDPAPEALLPKDTAALLREAVAAMAAEFTPPAPNTWCKIVCTKAGDPVLVVRDWDGDEDCEVVRLELRKKFSMTLSLSFRGDKDTAIADEAFAAITGDNIDDVLKTRGVDSIMAVVDGGDDGQ